MSLSVPVSPLFFLCTHIKYVWWASHSWMRGYHGNWAAVFYVQIRWMKPHTQIWFCMCLYISTWTRCAIICKDDSSLSDDKSVHFICVSPHYGAESSYITEAVVFTSRHQQRQFVLEAFSPKLLTLFRPLSHSHTFSNAQLYQQGWSAIKWCFIKPDEADVGVWLIHQ